MDVCGATAQRVKRVNPPIAWLADSAKMIYHVRCERPGLATCDCPGGTYKGRCKHSAAILKLIELGKLPGPTQRQPQPSVDHEFDNA